MDWCGCSPNDFRLDDWTRIQTTQPRQLYFARKFEPIVNQAVLLKLELWLHGMEKPSHKVANLHGYWQNLYHYRDRHQSSSNHDDDSLMTVVSAALRAWSSKSSCLIETIGKPLEVTSYHLKDRYKYTLILFDIVSIKSSRIEIAFKPQSINSWYQIAPCALIERVDELIVSSAYDQKEQITRNFARILSPYSEPVLIYKFFPDSSNHNINNNNNDKSSNLTCLWIDPYGNFVDISEIVIDEKAVQGHSKPTLLKQPHQPGIWTVKLIYRDLLFAEVKFLITPLQFYAGSPVTDNRKQSNIINNGSTLVTITSDYFNKFLPALITRSASSNNNKFFGQNLLDWIDSLFNQFYVVEKMCLDDDDDHKTTVCGIIEHCSRTNWSSLAVDAKSAIDSYYLNQTSGSFVIW